MKTSEAEEVFGMVCAIYDLHPDRTQALASVWVAALKDLEAADAMTVIGPWLKGRAPERMPMLPAFVADVIGVAKAQVVSDKSYRACQICEDGAWVVVGVSECGTDQAAPCPACARGKMIEFPLERVGPYGKEGYWRGRNWQRGSRPLEVEMLSV
jgi:hypothetical protein